MCIWLYVCIHIYIYTWHVYIHNMYTCTYSKNVCVYIYIYMYIFMHIPAHVHRHRELGLSMFLRNGLCSKLTRKGLSWASRHGSQDRIYNCCCCEDAVELLASSCVLVDSLHMHSRFGKTARKPWTSKPQTLNPKPQNPQTKPKTLNRTKLGGDSWFHPGPLGPSSSRTRLPLKPTLNSKPHTPKSRKL